MGQACTQVCTLTTRFIEPADENQGVDDSLTVPVQATSKPAAEGSRGGSLCHKDNLELGQYNMERLRLGANFHVFNINLHEGEDCRQNVERYYRLCKDFKGLHVTTSCFTVWRKNKKTNGFAKVIPAIANATASPRKSGKDKDPGRPVRVFFFDDNLEWEGGETHSGICNLRDVQTGRFVDFGEGTNGFRRADSGRHTAIHYSTEYRAVLVKANILDAMEDPEYFTSLIRRFSEPGEYLIVYMDVNSTIMCNDSMQGKDWGGTLLGTLFEFIELRPKEGFDLDFTSTAGTFAALRVDKPKTMKALVKDLCGTNHIGYSAFWTEDICYSFFDELARYGELIWIGQETPLTLEAFQRLFQDHLGSIRRVTTKDGIAASWFRVAEELQKDHTVVLNSFGVDTRKVVLATAKDEKDVQQVTVNYELWDQRDVKKFESQFFNGDTPTTTV